MNPFRTRLVLVLGLACAWVTVLPAAEPAVIAKARAFIATEETLNGLRSVHFLGTMVTADPADPKKNMTVSMDIMFQSPNQQRLVATSDRAVEITALDGYDGWGRVEDPKNPGRARQMILTIDRIRRLRANTWENLAFYRGIEKAGGRVEDQGTAVVEGVTCQKLAFIHMPNIIFYRYFDPATGRLILTETESGDTVREQGEMVVNGIRFPRSIVTTNKDEKGELRTATITFDKVIVNEPIPGRQFGVPGYGAR